MSLEFSNSPLFGLWQPRLQLKHLYYGSNCVEKHLLDTLPSPSSKVYIVTGRSLAAKTPLVRQLETLLGHHHAGTFAGIKQHGPIADIDLATEAVMRDTSIDTMMSLGGGSPIDSAKVISYRAMEKTGKFLTHLTIPTTLSAAECTAGGGYTKADGVKVGFRSPEMGVTAIFYDPQYAGHTPKELWLATGMRAMDHAVECFYHPYATEMPWKALSMWAVSTLFECLPKARDSHPHDADVITRLLLAAFASSGLKGENLKGGMGLSHSLGHALGSPYGISHGITSCLTLGRVVKLKAQESRENARQIARLLPATGGRSSVDDLRDALDVGDRILRLVDSLDLHLETLSEKGVSKDEIPVIVQRATGGLREGPVYDTVFRLVQSLFEKP